MKSAIVKSIFLFIIFFNQIFAKDFDDLFNITIEVKGETIDKSIDRSFNNLVFRLIGSQDNEKVKIMLLIAMKQASSFKHHLMKKL